MCGGRLSVVMDFSYEACMVASRGVVSLGSSFMCFVVAWRSRVALRVSMEVQSEVLGPGLSPFGILAMLTLVGWICRVHYSLLWRCVVRRLFQLCSPISHMGARCLSSCLEYYIGVHCSRTILSHFFVPICP